MVSNKGKLKEFSATVSTLRGMTKEVSKQKENIKRRNLGTSGRKQEQSKQKHE